MVYMFFDAIHVQTMLLPLHLPRDQAEGRDRETEGEGVKKCPSTRRRSIPAAVPFPRHPDGVGAGGGRVRGDRPAEEERRRDSYSPLAT